MDAGKINFNSPAINPGNKKLNIVNSQVSGEVSDTFEKSETDNPGNMADGIKKLFNKKTEGTTGTYWTFEFSGEKCYLAGTKPAFGKNGMIYFGSHDRKIYALDLIGQKKWEFSARDMVRSSPAIGSDGTVYAGSSDGKLYALDGDTGRKKWEAGLGERVETSPVISKDGKTIFVGGMDNNPNIYSIHTSSLYAFDTQTGKEKWKFPIKSNDIGSPVINDEAVLISDEKKLYSINQETGEKQWEFHPGPKLEGSPVVGPDGSIYQVDTWGKLYSVNKAGEKNWVYEANDTAYKNDQPKITKDGAVIFSSFYNIYSVNGSTGDKNWKLSRNENDCWSSPEIGDDGNIYAGCSDSNVYAIDDKTGAVKWTCKTDSSLFGTPSVGPDGILFIGGEGKMYAISLPDNEDNKSNKDVDESGSFIKKENDFININGVKLPIRPGLKSKNS